jgi:hypothetical protein
MNLPSLRSLSLAALVALGLGEPACVRAQVAPVESVASAPTATNPGADGGSAQVEVTALREPIEFPYQRAYDAAVKVRDASHGRADLVVTIIEAHPLGTPLRVSLQYGDTVEPLDLDPSNTFLLAPNRAALGPQAILTVNRRRSGLSLHVGLRPHVEAGAALTRADINRWVEGGQAARKSLVPWYARLFLPNVRAVRLCSLAAGGQFALRAPDGTDRPLPTRDDKDVYARPAHCVDLLPTDDVRETAMSVVMPPDSTVDYAATGF